MPDIIELDDGNYVVIGELASPNTIVRTELPKYGVDVNVGEEAVIIPRRYIVEVARELLRNEDIN
jgi:hypothetical protein